MLAKPNQQFKIEGLIQQHREKLTFFLLTNSNGHVLDSAGKYLLYIFKNSGCCSIISKVTNTLGHLHERLMPNLCCPAGY